MSYTDKRYAKILNVYGEGLEKGKYYKISNGVSITDEDGMFRVLRDCVQCGLKVELLDDKPFTKSGLKEGMRVVSNKGDTYAVVSDSNNCLGLVRDKGYLPFTDLSEEMVWKNRDRWVVSVYKAPSLCRVDMGFFTCTGDLLWEKPEEAEEMTLEQVCKELGKDIKIVKGDK